MNDTVTRLVSPFVMVIFGATGDLTQRKLLPSLYHLYCKQILPEYFYIIGFSRRSYSDFDFHQFLEEAIKKHDADRKFDQKKWQAFAEKIHYQRGDFREVNGYMELINRLKEFDDARQACVPRFFYFSTPPDQYETILDFLYRTKLSQGCGHGSDKWTKMMVEKPFGRNFNDAKALDAKLARIFKEEQIYRIDHYLGKETVQNIVAFRYGNILFEPIWNRQYIDHIQITIAETLGVETRGNFYEGIGALRDMVQSHLLQLLAAVAMDQPRSFDAEGMRDVRAKLIQSINLIKPEEVGKHTVRGQYDRGKVALSPGVTDDVSGYRDEEKVANNSNTETFVALKLGINQNKWQGVPFYVRSGKRLKQKLTEITVVFKEPNFRLFLGKKNVSGSITNALTFKIQPNEGIILAVNAKKTGLETVFQQVPLHFDYSEEKADLPDAYERLLLDAIRGDQTLFTRTDEVAASWGLVSQIAEGWWYEGDPHFPNYPAGSWGPEAAEELMRKDGREWLTK